MLFILIRREFEWVRLRDNFDKLKRPSELFGSLIQLSDDKLSANQLSDLDLDPEDEKILKRALSDKHFNLNGVESTWSADKRSNDQLGKSGKYVSGHSSTAGKIPKEYKNVISSFRIRLLVDVLVI